MLLLNAREQIMGHALVGIGTVSEVLAHPREIFRTAIIAAASGICLIHNHPSGDFEPSSADEHNARAIAQIGQLVRIHLLDSIVMGQPRTTGSGRRKRAIDHVSLRDRAVFTPD